MNNSVSDTNLASLVKEISRTEGMKGFGIISNSISHEASEAITDFIDSKSF